MQRTLWLLALVSLAASAAPGRTEVFIRTPFFRIAVGRPAGPTPPAVHVQAPFVEVLVRPAPPDLLLPPPAPLVVPAPGTTLPALPPAPPPPIRPPTHREFADTFQPAAGTYEVVLLHPTTQAPVKVCFTLPPGSPRVQVDRRGLEFDYGRHEVEIRFLHGGRVRVSYHD